MRKLYLVIKLGDNEEMQSEAKKKVTEVDRPADVRPKR